MHLTDQFSKIWESFMQLGYAAVKVSKRVFTPAVLFILILGLGIFARVWEFPHLPPGLNQDEATIGIEAYDLLHYGVDRNGISYPVNFVSWGDGMDALYGYVLIPFVAFGLSPLTVRLPALLSGILTLPLIYFIGKRSSGIAFGLLSMFLLAISPWHILMSRWGINENILPFVFSLGFVCLLLSAPGNAWFVAASVFFSLCLYVYGGAYLAIPIFMACAIPVMLLTKRVSIRNLIIGMVIFVFIAIPILLFVLVNTFRWDSINLGSVTIPRLPGTARFLYMSVIPQANPLRNMASNLHVLIKLLLIYQTDKQVWNTVEPFGYMYNFSFPMAVIGSIFLFPFRDWKNNPERLLIWAWLLASLCLGISLYANTNRIHLIFIPIILCTAYFLTWLGDKSKLALAVMVLIYLISFYSFTTVYHGKDYRSLADKSFFSGLIPALEDARQSGDQPICVTNDVSRPFIFIFFVEKLDPTLFFKQMHLENPEWDGAYRSFGRYTIGIESCPKDLNTIYVLSKDELPPNNGVRYKINEYDEFRVYHP